MFAHNQYLGLQRIVARHGRREGEEDLDRCGFVQCNNRLCQGMDGDDDDDDI